jgi:hypothetical protein
MAQYSYNGWLASKDPRDFGGLTPLIIGGESFAPGVRTGDVHTVLAHLALQLHVRVEPVIASGWHDADDWGYNFRLNRNANNLSCHASATAIDYNATRHPNKKRNTFSPPQRAEIRRICRDDLDGVVRWGGDFSSPDEMHFEIIGTSSQVARVAAKIRASSSPSTGVGPLRQGSTGPEVRRLQLFMNAMFPSYSRLEVDGHYGLATVTAVKEFQKRTALEQDGVIGPATKMALGRFGWK